jgi:hypothetical protein
MTQVELCSQHQQPPENLEVSARAALLQPLLAVATPPAAQWCLTPAALHRAAPTAFTHLEKDRSRPQV